MTTEEIIAEIAEAANSRVELLSVQMPMTKVPGWDSMAVVVFMGAIDERLSVTLDAEAISSCRTILELTELVQRVSLGK